MFVLVDVLFIGLFGRKSCIWCCSWNQLIKVGLLVKMVNARDPAMSEFEELAALGNMESPPLVVWLVLHSESEDETSRVERFLVPGVEMVFPRSLEVADDLIPLYVEPREFELVVVSSDRECSMKHVRQELVLY